MNPVLRITIIPLVIGILAVVATVLSLLFGLMIRDARKSAVILDTLQIILVVVGILAVIAIALVMVFPS